MPENIRPTATELDRLITSYSRRCSIREHNIVDYMESNNPELMIACDLLRSQQRRDMVILTALERMRDQNANL